MSDALTFVVIVLASYRLWRLWAEDVLPPVVWLRDRFEAATLARFGPAWAGGAFCAWCSGFWFCVAVWGATWAVRPLPLPWAWPWAMNCVVGLIAQRDEA